MTEIQRLKKELDNAVKLYNKLEEDLTEQYAYIEEIKEQIEIEESLQNDKRN